MQTVPFRVFHKRTLKWPSSTERASLENNVQRADKELKDAEAAFAAGGGKHWKAHKDRSDRLVHVRSLEKQLRGKLSQTWQGKMKEEFAHEDAQRMLELAGRTRATMQLFLQQVTQRKIDRLGQFPLQEVVEDRTQRLS